MLTKIITGFILSSGLLLSSCDFISNSNSKHAEYWDDYYTALIRFDTVFIEHFPDVRSNKIKNYFVYSPTIDKRQCGYGAQLMVEYSDAVIDSFLTYFSSVESYHNSVFVIGIDSISTGFSDSTLLIPDFYVINKDWGWNDNKSTLPPDFSYFILDRKNGQYGPLEYLCERKELPLKWKHGYTKGLSISKEKNLVLYWVEVW
jgi:hypothetical protein